MDNLTVKIFRRDKQMGDLEHQTKMSAAEHAALWSQYINDSLSCCVLRYFLNDTKDEDIKKSIQFALELAESHLVQGRIFLEQDNQPIPIGFTDEDVNVNAESLFTDTFKIYYLHIMSIHGLTRYAGATSICIREDIRKYLIECTSQTLKLYDNVTSVLLEKGIISKPPSLNNKQSIKFISKKSSLTGWLSKRRPINAIEISGVYLNLQKTMMKTVLEMGFGQVSQSKEVREFMRKARKLCNKHFETLSSVFRQESLHIPRGFETEVTDSTIPPFSDKLMLFHITTLHSAAIGYYSDALSMGQRRDLFTSYSRMSLEMSLSAEDGLNILMENEWLEQPPIAVDRDGLTKDKKR